MGNCCRKKSKRSVVLLLVGLDNAGKTVTVKGLVGDNFDNSIPTVGFSTFNLKHANMKVTVYDLGGSQDIRGIWPRYFVDVHGVIFVIDSSDYGRLNEAKSVLHVLLSHEKISGKPVLLLANKQDYDNALDEIDIAEKLELENLVNEQKCPTLVESCSARKLYKNKLDPGIKNGYQWLLNYISREYDNLNYRVQKDVQDQLKQETEKRKQQILKMKNKPHEQEIEVDINHIGNPFKPIKDVITENNFLQFLNHKSIESKNRSNSALSTHSSPQLVINKPKDITKQRPKSAIDGVKKQLKKTNRKVFTATANKIAPVTLFTPKKTNTQVHINKIFVIENGNSTIEQMEDALIITELPNTPLVQRGDNNITTMFMSNKFKTDLPPSKLPPIVKQSNDASWTKKPLRSKHFVEDDIDRICKDIS